MRRRSIRLLSDDSPHRSTTICEIVQLGVVGAGVVLAMGAAWVPVTRVLRLESMGVLLEE